MFASVDLARRIEAAEVRLSASTGRQALTADPAAGAFVENLAGGVVVYTGPSSPMNKMIGVGFAGLPPEDRLASIEARFARCGAPLQAEVATLADPTFAACLSRRGYVLQNFENVSGRPLTDDDLDSAAGGIAVEATDTAADEWIDTAITAFQHPDARGVPADELPPRDALEAALRPFMQTGGFLRYTARIGGRLAGVASLRLDTGLAQLCGAATLPEFRRRGVQGALLRCRLADARRSGCDLAVLTTQPGSTSQENGHRRGFALLYTRAILVKAATAC